MSERTRGAVTLHFGDGEVIDTWQKVTLHDSFVDPLGELTLETRPPVRFINDYRKRLAKGELVTLLVNGVNQGGFLIVDSNREHDDQGSTFMITCKTPLCTPYEADIDPDKSSKQQTDVPVDQVLLEALFPFGFDTIISDDKGHVDLITGKPIGNHAAAPNATKLTIKEASAHAGETVYQYISRIITPRGVCLRMSATGTLMLSAPDYQQDVAYTLCGVMDQRRAIKGADFFIGKVGVDDTNEGQFSECRVFGQRDSGINTVGTPGTSRPDSGRVIEAELHPNRPCYSSPIAAPYKPKIIKFKSVRDKEHARNVCALELGLRAAKAFVVRGTVDGFVSTTGRIWSVDTIARVVIEQEEMDENMWILERSMALDAQGGQRTSLKLITRGSLTIGVPGEGE